MIEKLSIINLSCYRCKSYASVVLDNSDVTFFREEEDAAFAHCFIVFWEKEKLD